MLFPLFDLNPHRRFPLITLILIALNVAVNVWTWRMPERRRDQIAMQYGFVPARLSHMGEGQAVVAPVLEFNEQLGRPVPVGMLELSTAPRAVYTTFLTTMFLHGGWWHLIMNMWMLWVFGNNIEDRLGHLVYLGYYLLGGIVATLAYWATDSQSLMPVVGASGAVAAVLGGYAVTFPTAKVRTLIFFLLILIVDIPALVLLGLWFVLQVFSGLLGLWGVALEPVAFWAHIGGFLAGMVLMPIFGLGTSPPGTDWRKESDELFRFEDQRFRES
jgi:membrane associated rhomboid family serine protease